MSRVTAFRQPDRLALMGRVTDDPSSI